MEASKRIALVAHDSMKDQLLAWVRHNSGTLTAHQLWSTGTTGTKIKEACPELRVTALKSGPLGGDQQVGAMIADGALDILLFFTDALSPHPHDADVQALTRLSTLYNVALATNRTTADFLITSPFFGKPFQPTGGGDGEPADPDAQR
ncbi:methylglyoxal synthase (plasmid) [Skermanella mucosa]|uniref:methylglyoxal synthase n=1 Tax=Skermanella mucosa TaxID=1789672 RepID=UPI00192CDBF5|nr:methylglyoxal synthase [Skermanella mucosa]UEM24603.1 methylglyoxal synthase [Skermanella mucosa]